MDENSPDEIIDPSGPEYSGIEAEEESLIKGIITGAFLSVVYPILWIVKIVKGGESGELKNILIKKYSIRVIEIRKVGKEMKTNIYSITDARGIVYKCKFNKDIDYLLIEKEIRK